MAYYVRLMRRADVGQVSAIDQEAFPGQWPPPNYQQELSNQLAHYIVACDDSRTTAESREPAGIVNRIKHLFGGDDTGKSVVTEYIAGFAGIWLMADEAHITAIAVRGVYQGKGLGELLLMSILDLARERRARIATLEVRVSNSGAQALYEKYGFTDVGIRKAYYTDNREDAIIMSTEDVSSAAFLARFRELKEAFATKRGERYHSLGWAPAPPGRR